MPFGIHDNNSYYCTPEEECPLEYSKLIYGEKQCVKDCSSLTKKNKTKEYRKTCYQDCPVEEKLLVQPQIGNICRAKCPNFEEPFEMVEKQICVSNCTMPKFKIKFFLILWMILSIALIINILMIIRV